MKEEKTGSNETRRPKAHLNGMGRDEMNLAEFPLATLADRVPQGCKTLVFEDRIWDREPEAACRPAADDFGIRQVRAADRLGR